MFEWLISASAAGFGAFFGALGAYFLSRHNEKKRRENEYLCLLLLVHEHLESLYTLLADIPNEHIKEIDGEKVVVFDLPLPDFAISTEQMQTLMEVSPDKQMPSTLIQMQYFLQSHSYRVAKTGSNILPLSWIQQQVWQLKGMLLSVRVQYEQASGDDFPLDYATEPQSRK